MLISVSNVALLVLLLSPANRRIKEISLFIACMNLIAALYFAAMTFFTSDPMAVLFMVFWFAISIIMFIRAGVFSKKPTQTD
ncbi:hypothetical protein COB80_00210 [Candidatus Kaiserbacteria bacterium]|nr:MAG: hypothetical protein COB80_00210 [Candidatus Kaiserbacteria bacterium]